MYNMKDDAHAYTISIPMLDNLDVWYNGETPSCHVTVTAID